MMSDGDASRDASQRVKHVDGRVAQMQRAPIPRRDLILDAMVEVVAERGFAGASVAAVCKRGKVSRRTFYECFDGLESCFVAVMQMGLERAGTLIFAAFRRERDWPAGVRAALAALLDFFDSEPALARAWMVESLAAGAWALEQRERNVTVLRTAIVSWWSGPELTVSGESPPLAAEGAMASIMGVIQGHLVGQGERGPLIELLGPLTGLAVGPFLDPEQVAAEVQRGYELAAKIQAERASGASPLQPGEIGPELCPVEIPALLRNAKAERARECVLYLLERGRRGFSPSNREIASAIGIAHKGQISKLLARLETVGVLSKTSHGAGRPNAWRLTEYGQEIAVHFELQKKD